MTVIEPTADVDLLELVGVSAGDPSLPQARLRQSSVVNHHGHPVAREPDVQFNSVGSVAKSPRE